MHNLRGTARNVQRTPLTIPHIARRAPGAGLALAGGLRAAEVPTRLIERATATLVRRLNYFTPHVEPASHEPGVFWLDASGLERRRSNGGRPSKIELGY